MFKLLHLLRNQNSSLLITFLTTWSCFAFRPEGRAGTLWKLSELLNYVFARNLLFLIPSTISSLQFLRLSLHWTKWRRPTRRSWGIDMQYVVAGWATNLLKPSKPRMPEFCCRLNCSVISARFHYVKRKDRLERSYYYARMYVSACVHLNENPWPVLYSTHSTISDHAVPSGM
jgi:hypothetical protein